MNEHVGSCRMLLMALQQLMPGKLISFASHKPGLSDECFLNIIEQLIEQAVENALTAKEYAIVCKQVAEFFSPNPNDPSSKVNQFKRQVITTLQKKFEIR